MRPVRNRCVGAFILSGDAGCLPRSREDVLGRKGSREG
jgi:hypothetical protein